MNSLRTVAMLVAATIVVVVVLTMGWRPGGAPSVPSGMGNAENGMGSLAPDPDHVRAPVGWSEETRAATTPLALEVSGRVLDQEGVPIAGVAVFIGAEESPFPEALEGLAAGGMNLKGMTLTTGEDGSFQATLASPRRVFVQAMRGETLPLRADPALVREAWVVPPERDLVLGLRRLPYATCAVRVFDHGSGKHLDEFKLYVSGPSLTASLPVVGGVCELALPLPDGVPLSYSIGLRAPKPRLEVRESVHVSVGDHRDVVLSLSPAPILRGIVLDESGGPIEGVHVVSGQLRRLTGDELFGRAEPNRVKGASTDAAGRYEIAQLHDRLTFWHPRFESSTEPASDSMRVTLRARGAITVQGTGGVNAVHAKLDGWQEPVQREDGSVRFEGVDNGLHLIEIQDRASVLVELLHGDDVTVALRDVIPSVELRLSISGLPAETDPFGRGVLVGLEPLSSFCDFAIDDGLGRASNVVPGEYLLTTTNGFTSLVEVDGAEVHVDVEGATLTVQSREGGTYSLMPRRAAAIPAPMRARFAFMIPAGGDRIYGPLAHGAYALCNASTGFELELEVVKAAVVEVP